MSRLQRWRARPLTAPNSILKFEPAAGGPTARVGHTVEVTNADPNPPAVDSDVRPEPADMPTSVLYVAAVESFMIFARTLTDGQWLQPVPCLPGWDVRDVLSHVAGVPDDGVAGRMEGAPGEAWTASQVERNRDMAVGEHRPPFDCHAHEHDIRHALGLAGNRDSLVVQAAEVQLARSIEAPVTVTVTLDDRRTLTSGEGDGATTLEGISGFEVFRSRLGRRSRSPVATPMWQRRSTRGSCSARRTARSSKPDSFSGGLFGMPRGRRRPFV